MFTRTATYQFNETEVNLNPDKTFRSPFLLMVHGSSKTVFRYLGHQDLVLDFNPEFQSTRKCGPPK